MREVVLDDKYRVVLDKRTREIAAVKKGDRLAVIPFKGGVILVSARGRKFTGSLAGFGFNEERHEAAHFIFRRKS